MKGIVVGFFKKNRFIFNFNAKIKCIYIKYRYKKIVSLYKEKEQEYSIEELLIKKGFDKEWRGHFIEKRPKIFYLGTDEFQDKSGFLQALNKYAYVTIFTKEDGSYGQHGREKGCISRNKKRLFELFKKLDSTNNLPDILLMQTWAWRIGLDTLLALKEQYKYLKVINISMDDRHTFYDYGNSEMGTCGLIPALDMTLTAAPEAVDWYLKENIPSIFFPEASSLDFFHPMNIEKKYDVGFVGAKYGIREEIVNTLVNSGVNVQCYGNGWENGRLPLEDTNRFFNQCKIILGVGTVGYCQEFYALKLRDFDAPLSGSCYVTHDNHDLHKLFDSGSLVLCKDTSEYVSNIKELLHNQKKIHVHAKLSFLNAKDSHTYEDRILSLFKILGLSI